MKKTTIDQLMQDKIIKDLEKTSNDVNAARTIIVNLLKLLKQDDKQHS